MLIRYGSLEGRFGSLLSAANHDIEYEYEGRWIVLLPKEEEPVDIYKQHWVCCPWTYL
jgi:hypothetical protein